MIFNMKNKAKNFIFEETASWPINRVSSKRNDVAYKIAQGKKAGKRVRQEISRARNLANQKQFKTTSAQRKKAEIEEYTPSSISTKKQVKDTLKKLK